MDESPSYQAPNGRGGAGPGDRYGAGAGFGGQRERGAANRFSAAGYNGDGYQDPGYGRADNGASRRGAAAAPGGQWNGSGHGGSGRPGGSAHAQEFTPADNADLDEDGPGGTPRPYGRLSIYTLHKDKTREFDRVAERAAEGVRAAEPDTLVYVIHVVPKAPLQRIIYEIYRDRAAFLAHERQPHIRQFAADRASCVLATNVVDLRLKYAKVAALGSAPDAALPPQANRMPRAREDGAGGDRYQQAATQQQPAQYQPAQYQPAQYQPAQYQPAQPTVTQYARPQSQQPGAASFTPAKEQYADLGQQTVGREAYQSQARYGSNGTGGPAAGNGQYDAANVHLGAAGYANGGSYSSAKGYQSPNGYPAGNGYSNGTGYSASSGYSNGSSYQNGADHSATNGYQASNGYSNGSSYQNGAGYPNGNGNSATGGYPNGAGFQNGNRYGAADGSPGDNATPGPQYTPRYRELTSGASPDGGAGGAPGDGGRQSYRPQSAERAPRSPEQR